MPDYKFTGSSPMIFPLELGSDAEVTPAPGNPSVGPTGSTVYLFPLDVLHTKQPIEHAWLEPIDAPATKPAVAPTAAVTQTMPEKPAAAGTDAVGATPGDASA